MNSNSWLADLINGCKQLKNLKFVNDRFILNRDHITGFSENASLNELSLSPLNFDGAVALADWLAKTEVVRHLEIGISSVMSDEEFEQLMVKLADNSALVSLTLNLSQQNSAQVQRKLNKLSDYFRKYDHKNISYLVIHEGLEHRLFSGFSDSFQENREAALQLWNKIADGALSSLRTEDFKAIQERFAIISDAETIGQLTIKLKNATSFTVLLSAVREAGIEHCGIDIAVLPSKEVKHSIGISPNGNHADKLTPNALRAQLLKHRGVTILGK